MKVNGLSYENWRNLVNGGIEADDKINIFYGDNAQGKTNLLEAIYLCTGQKSFRANRESELIKRNCDYAVLQLDYDSQSRRQKIKLEIKDGKKYFKNGVQCKSDEINESFSAIIFAPVHLSLIKNGPEERRRFLDGGLCGLKPAYRKLTEDYKRTVIQRNSILRDVKYHSELSGMLDIFEENIASLGSHISKQRTKYTEALTPYVNEIFSGLSHGNEIIDLVYTGEEYSVENNGYEKLLTGLKKSRMEDIKTLSTSIGPHRHDLDIKINGYSARAFGSQGQQRSAALALKLAEAAVINGYSGERPVALLDDVMSELDTKRQDYILNRLTEWQVFITCCDPLPIYKKTGGKTFLINDGQVDISEKTDM